MFVPVGTTFVSATPVQRPEPPTTVSYVQSGGTVTGTPTGGVVVAGHNDQFVLVVHASQQRPGRLDHHKHRHRNDHNHRR